MLQHVVPVKDIEGTATVFPMFFHNKLQNVSKFKRIDLIQEILHTNERKIISFCIIYIFILGVLCHLLIFDVLNLNFNQVKHFLKVTFVFAEPGLDYLGGLLTLGAYI